MCILRSVPFPYYTWGCEFCGLQKGAGVMKWYSVVCGCLISVSLVGQDVERAESVIDFSSLLQPSAVEQPVVVPSPSISSNLALVHGASSQDLTIVCGSDRQRKLASVGAWATALGLYGCVGSLCYSFAQSLYQEFLHAVPFVSLSSEKSLSHMASTATACAGVAGLFYALGRFPYQIPYIFYSGERLSPEYALQVLQEIKLYVHYIVLIDKIRDQINQLVTSIEAHKEVLLPLECSGSFEKLKAYVPLCQRVVDRHEIMASYIIVDLNRLFEQAVIEREVACRSYKDHEDFSWIVDDRLRVLLSDFYAKVTAVQEKIQVQSQVGVDVNDMQATTQNLMAYWQDIVRGAYQSIQDNLKECRALYAIEQFIIQRLNRPLCVGDSEIMGKTSKEEA